ncbi:MAG: asparagine synthase (glutamine-hydrolyzing) [Verrucomicrobia bacterium]|nr:asparagine synthase (glutamine-hydrolyzing) [Verrucomicrobiota bacterium]
MCGIAGFVGEGSPQELEKGIGLACRALAHRGPDDCRWVIRPDVALGATRLAIRDSLRGVQPMETNGVTIVFNGELYGCEPLRKQLEQVGYVFKTQSDTEVFLYGFLEKGPAIFDQVSGMFACGIWDEKEKKLYLARDRWGEKPLYYVAESAFIAFASEIKGLWGWPSIEQEMQEEDVPGFLRRSYIAGPYTGWKKVRKLRAGSWLMWQAGKWSETSYFKPEVAKGKTNPEALFEMVDLSVKECLVSDRPVGAFLSGGLDSSTVAYFLSRHRPKAPVFSLHWNEKEYSEEEFTTAVAQALGLTHHSMLCDVKYFQEHFETIARYYDEPFADESMVPTVCLAQFAKNWVDVVLTGDGADELFHGYERYFFPGSPVEYSDVFAATSKASLQQICHPDFLQNLCPEILCDGGRERSSLDMTTYLPDDILAKVDRATMSVALEARAPFLTKRVSEFALRCSLEDLVGPEGGKHILRRAMQGKLLPKTLQRKKMGFGVPLAQWFRGPLHNWMRERLIDGSLKETGWFLMRGITELIQEHVSGQSNRARSLLNLLVLEIWVRETAERFQIISH